MLHIRMDTHTHTSHITHFLDKSMVTDTPAVTGETQSQRSTMAMALHVTHSVISSSHPPSDKEID